MQLWLRRNEYGPTPTVTESDGSSRVRDSHIRAAAAAVEAVAV